MAELENFADEENLIYYDTMAIRCYSGIFCYNPQITYYWPLVLISICLKSIIIVSSHLSLDLPKGLFPVGAPIKILKGLLPSTIL